MPFVQNDKKEAFESCFPDVRTRIQETSQNTVIMYGAVRRSRRIQVIRILGFPKLKTLFEESIEGSDPDRGVMIHGSSIGSRNFGTGQGIDPVPVEK